ncbi:MAG: metal-dependent hydrolase [Acidobacteria bacterium]|nr:metal-dependent hydrolase [Acidobacteriota bacterium]
MPSIGHIAVGAAAGRALSRRQGSRAAAVTLFSAVSLLPDLDGIAFPLGIPYAAPFGHRGASHSLAAAAAAGLLCGAAGKAAGLPFSRAALAGAAVTASHGLLDTLTDGGLGVALLWPFSNRRFFAPWRPIPVAPIGFAMLSARGAFVVAAEAAMFLPFFLYAFWPRRRGGGPSR